MTHVPLYEQAPLPGSGESGHRPGSPIFERDRAFAAEMKRLRIGILLRDIVDQQGDVDAYMRRVRPRTAPGAADRGGDCAEAACADRAVEAFDIVEAARTAEGNRGRGTYELDQVHLDCLVALGRAEEAPAFQWMSFEKTLNPHRLRDFLKALPDFDDVEAEERAKAIALAFPHFTRPRAGAAHVRGPSR